MGLIKDLQISDYFPICFAKYFYKSLVISMFRLDDLRTYATFTQLIFALLK